MKHLNKYLILENDQFLFGSFKNFVSALKDTEIIYSASNTSIDDLTKAFEKNNIILINPTMITYSQYNSFMMLMYSLMLKDKLGIKELYLYNLSEDNLEILNNLWKGNRKYIDKITKKIKIYIVKDFLYLEHTNIFHKDQIFI